MQKVLVILGPTGIGKSKVAINLAKMLDGEIISADSMQVYRELNIGTAKVTEEEKQNIPHYLLDIRDIKEDYSAYQFVVDARAIIKDILSRQKIPIIVGGTGLYVSALVYKYDFHSEENQKEFSQDDNEYVLIGLTEDRKYLYDKINARVDQMVSEGLIEEAKFVYENANNGCLKAIGYKEFFQYFKGEKTLEESIETLKKHTRNYAKRQFTWLRPMKNLNWVEKNDNTINNIIKIFEDKKND